ncbi:MAG TPA: heme ABC transporter permease [Gammaproteobacteria bacterium]|nr:heme ABC transporter permease [Gammaproteobacteria bacterium]
MLANLRQLASPKNFYQFAGTIYPWILFLAVGTLCFGLVWGLLYSPPDYQQGETVRIMYLHVPMAIMSMAAYMVMAGASAVGLVWHLKTAHIVARSCAPIGAMFTLVTLVTGALWGKPMWGTWWQWDARLTSELILLFLYLGYIGLYQAIDVVETAERACALLALVGVVNIPIIHFSVEWWHTLHQGPTISRLNPTIDASLMGPLYLMILAHWMIFMAYVLMHSRTAILARERKTQWVKSLV